MSKPQYFDDLTLEQMFEQYDHTHMMSDDHRAWQNGQRQREIWMKKIQDEHGGWTKELVDMYNKHAPAGRFQLDWQFIKMAG